MRVTRFFIGFFLLSFAGSTAPRAAEISSAPWSAVRVYPNPWRADRHAHFLVTFAGLPAAATVRLYALNGHAVKTLVSDAEGKAAWDRTNQSGVKVASGVYLYTASYGDSKPILGKVILIR